MLHFHVLCCWESKYSLILSNELTAYRFGSWRFCSDASAEKSMPQSKIGRKQLESNCFIFMALALCGTMVSPATLGLQLKDLSAYSPLSVWDTGVPGGTGYSLSKADVQGSARAWQGPNCNYEAVDIGL